MILNNMMALEITKLYLSSIVDKNIKLEEFTRLFNSTYNEVCNILDTIED